MISEVCEKHFGRVGLQPLLNLLSVDQHLVEFHSEVK